jgi:hypothetical protein
MKMNKLLFFGNEGDIELIKTCFYNDGHKLFLPIDESFVEFGLGK